MDPERQLLGNLVLARSGVDRAAEHRGDASWVAARRADPASRVMQVADGAARMSHGPGTALAFQPATDVDPEIELTLLGVDGGVTYFAEHRAERADEGWADLRQAGADLGDRDAGLMVTAVALDNWNRTHLRCPRCGSPTEQSMAG